MIDGFDIRYYDRENMPVMAQMADSGFFKQGSAIFPSLTNANNISIACAAWPEEHGVTTNCYFDAESGGARFLESPEFLMSRTIFEKMGEHGRTALLTCKAKTAKILGEKADIVIAAEEPSDVVIAKYGMPPAMYSADINYWLIETGRKIVQENKDISLIYIHTTDYPMHMWAPEEAESIEHMRRIDELLGDFYGTAPEYAMALTADHGMNSKTVCWDLAKACANRGLKLKFAVSPVADRLLKHHGGFGGVSYVYLENAEDYEQAFDIIMSLEGVENVLDRETAAHLYSLVPDRIGDMVVIPDVNTVFGDLETEKVVLPDNYRSHGSLYELNIPLLLFNFNNRKFRHKEINYNIDVTKQIISEEG
jgi:phosphonoacetate hydrolase